MNGWQYDPVYIISALYIFLAAPIPTVIIFSTLINLWPFLWGKLTFGIWHWIYQRPSILFSSQRASRWFMITGRTGNPCNPDNVLSTYIEELHVEIVMCCPITSAIKWYSETRTTTVWTLLVVLVHRINVAWSVIYIMYIQIFSCKRKLFNHISRVTYI